MAKSRGGPSVVGYITAPLPRVTGEDLNGGNSGRGKPCHKGVVIVTWGWVAAASVLA